MSKPAKNKSPSARAPKYLLLKSNIPDMREFYVIVKDGEFGNSQIDDPDAEAGNQCNKEAHNIINPFPVDIIYHGDT